ncbi:MAG: LacI family DNA-binding transcriptional regulator [Spirochaetes bacterium]|nr:LacI family DNA-binding transcriptional regulator [Spirochaetota bacterium]
MPLPKSAVTVKDIARHVGIHYTTVAHVLRDPQSPKASASTRAAVLKAAKRLGYRGNILASSLRRGLSGLAVVLCVPEREFLYYPYYQEVLAGLQEALTREGRALAVFGATPETQGRLGRLIDASLYSGLLAVGPEPCPELEKVAERVPTLQLNYRTPSKHRSWLLRDEEQAARLSLGQLASRGCRRLRALFLYRHPAQAARQEIYQRVAKEFPGMSLEFVFLSETPRILYSQAMVRELEASFRPERAKALARGCEAILCLSTYGELVYRQLLAAGIDIPGKLGFLMDGLTYVERIYYPEVSRVGVATETIIAAILGHFKKPAEGKALTLPSHFLEGKTLPGPRP